MNRNDMKSGLNNIWSIISKKIAGETSQAEDFAFTEWLVDKKNSELYKTIEQIKLECDYQSAMEMKEEVFNNTFDKIFSQFQTSKQKTPNRRRLFLSIAAGVALLVGCFSVFVLLDNKANNSLVLFSNTTGISKIILPDSTLVTLNENSSISYASNFDNGNLRTVSLQGEAFFTVKHNPQKPFIVHTEKIDVKVLGTEFNLNAYSNSDVVVTSLVSGSVELTEKTKKQVIELFPGQESTYNKTSASITLRAFDTDQITSWMNNNLVFRRQSFAAVCQMLEDRFDVEIEINNISIENKSLSGKFDQNESLADILDVIKTNVPFSYKIEEGKVTIY